MKHYLAYRYTLKSTDQSIFLFGFLIPFDDYIDGLDSNKKIEINVSEYHKFAEDSEEHGKYKDRVLVMETSVVGEDSFNVFNEKLNNNVFSFKMLGFEAKETLDEEVKILYSSEAFLDVFKSCERVISSHKYRYLWLCDRSEEIDILKILPMMNDYAHRLFVQSRNNQFGSFFLMNNSMIFKESFISIYSQNNIYSFGLLKKYNFTDHILHITLRNISQHVVVNKVIHLKDNIIEDISVSEDISGHYIEVFNPSGDLIYVDDYVYLRKICLGMNALGSSVVINDKLSKKNSELSSIGTSIKKNNSVVNAPIVSLDGYKKFYEFNNKISESISNIDIVKTAKKGTTEESYWYPKISDTQCISKIIEIVKDSDEATFVDPFFDAKEDSEYSGIQNLMAIIIRLEGKVTVITNSDNSDFLKSQFTNIKRDINIKLQIKKAKKDFHDRYLLVKKQDKQILYSLSNSINATMKNYPLGLFNVSGNPKDLIICEIESMVEDSSDQSNLIYNSDDLEKTTQSKVHNDSCLNLLNEDIKKDEFKSYVENNVSEIIDKFNKIRENDIAAYLYLADLQAYLCSDSEQYNQIESVLLESIEKIDDKKEFLEKVKINIFDKYIPKGVCFTKEITLSSIFSIDAYNDIDSFYKYGYRGTFNEIFGWTKLLEIIFSLDPDLLMDYLNSSKDNLFLGIYEKICIYAHFSDKDLLEYGNESLKLLGICRIFDQDQNQVELKDRINEIINRFIDHGIPKHLVFCIMIDKSYIFLDQKSGCYDENFIELLKSDIFKDILSDSNLEDYTKDLLTVLRCCNNSTLLLFKIILESNVMIDKNSRKVTKDFLQKYLKYKSSSLFVEWHEMNYIIGIIDFFSETDRKYILGGLYGVLGINKDYNEVSLPLFTYITSYEVHSEMFKKTTRLLCIYSAFSVNDSDNIDKLLNLLINRKQGDEETTFIIVGTLLRIILRDTDQIEDSEKIQSFFNFLKNNDRLSIFYDIYYKNYDEDTLKKYMDLVFKSQYNELTLLKTFSAIIIEIIHIQYLNSSDEREKNIDNVKTMINSYFNGKYTVK